MTFVPLGAMVKYAAREQMAEEGMVLDKYAYTTAIHAAAQLGKWARSVRYLEEMEENGVKRDVVAFSAAISACADKGQWLHVSERAPCQHLRRVRVDPS